MKTSLTTCFLLLIVTGTMVGYLAVGASIPAEAQALETARQPQESDRKHHDPVMVSSGRLLGISRPKAACQQANIARV